MKRSLFNSEQFVDESILNSATTVSHDNVTELCANNCPFFFPGVINPNTLLLTFHSNLTVTVDTQSSNASPFRCLFSNGIICGGHGIIDGTDSSVYTLDFSSLVPNVSGPTVTAYIVASASTVKESPFTVVGPPPGHPDYTPNFVPYTGYNIIQDTLNITATTTPPDNLTTIEIGRITLSFGETQIISVDTSHQVPARVSFSSIAGGDTSGSFPNPVVFQSSASPFTALHGAVVNGSLNVTSGITAGGAIAGANATQLGQAIMLGQLGGVMGSSGYITVPVYNPLDQSSHTFYLQWGVFDPQIPALQETFITLRQFNFPVSMPNKTLLISVNLTSTTAQFVPRYIVNINSPTVMAAIPYKTQGNTIIAMWETDAYDRAGLMVSYIALGY